MRYQEKAITAADGHEIPLYIWTTRKRGYQGLVQITHGLAEHAGRYAHTARYLNSLGYDVIAHDHRGHGRAQDDCLGHYNDRDGWLKIISDLDLISGFCSDAKRNGRHFLLAHSMGSFISLNYLMDHETAFDGIILSGSNYSPRAKFEAAEKIARVERLRLGRRGRSKLLDHLSFGSFNGHFKPNRTSHDWLSRDPEQVDLYLHDPSCGFIATTQLWCDFLGGLSYISRPANLRKLPTDIPYYLFAGEKDPVGHMGQGVMDLASQFRKAGIADITCTLYPDGRHEMLNETNKDQVLTDLGHWLSSRSTA